MQILNINVLESFRVNTQKFPNFLAHWSYCAILSCVIDES